MSEFVLQMGPMWILAGISAGWLADCLLHRRGYGLIVDMGLGVGASLAGGAALVALSGPRAGMFAMFCFGFFLAAGAIAAQRIAWRAAPDARERRAARWLTEWSRTSPAPIGVAAGDVRTVPPAPTRALARLATTGIYLLRGVPIEVQRAARIRAASEGTTLRQVLLRGLGEYGAGTWTPRPVDGSRHAEPGIARLASD